VPGKPGGKGVRQGQAVGRPNPDGIWEGRVGSEVRTEEGEGGSATGAAPKKLRQQRLKRANGIEDHVLGSPRQAAPAISTIPTKTGGLRGWRRRLREKKNLRQRKSWGAIAWESPSRGPSKKNALGDSGKNPQDHRRTSVTKEKTGEERGKKKAEPQEVAAPAY